MVCVATSGCRGLRLRRSSVARAEARFPAGTVSPLTRSVPPCATRSEASMRIGARPSLLMFFTATVSGSMSYATGGVKLRSASFDTSCSVRIFDSP